MLTLSTLPSSMVSREEDWPSPPVSPQHVGGAKAPCCPCFGASGGMNEEGRSNPMGTMIPPHQALGLPILGNLDPTHLGRGIWIAHGTQRQHSPKSWPWL